MNRSGPDVEIFDVSDRGEASERLALAGEALGVDEVVKLSCRSALARPAGVPVAGLFGEMDAIVGQHHMSLGGLGLMRVKGNSGVSLICRVDQLGDRKLAGAVDGHKHVKLVFGGLNLGDIHVEHLSWVGLKRWRLALPPTTFGRSDIPCR